LSYPYDELPSRRTSVTGQITSRRLDAARPPAEARRAHTLSDCTCILSASRSATSTSATSAVNPLSPASCQTRHGPLESAREVPYKLSITKHRPRNEALASGASPHMRAHRQDGTVGLHVRPQSAPLRRESEHSVNPSTRLLGTCPLMNACSRACECTHPDANIPVPHTPRSTMRTPGRARATSFILSLGWPHTRSPGGQGMYVCMERGRIRSISLL
jgi:hypothetical protein